MDNKDEVIDLRPPMDTVFNEFKIVKRVRQENNVSDENINIVPSNNKLELPPHDALNKESINVKEKNRVSKKNINGAPSNKKLEPEKKVYECDKCDFETLRKSSIYKHRATHLAPEVRQMFACAHCDNKYVSKTGLQHHLEGNHLDFRSKGVQEKFYKCDKCDFQTLLKINLKQHKKIHLAPEDRKMYSCEHCGKKYITRSGLQYHLEDNHIDSSKKESQKTTYKCSTCSYQTLHLSKLKVHEKIHLEPKDRGSFACAQCDSKYMTREGLYYHLKVNHIDSRKSKKTIHKCSKCSYETIHKFKLNVHEKTHLAPEKRQMFACSQCQNEYKTKEGLRRHIQDHVDVSSRAPLPHKCSTCSYQTRYITNLRHHEKVHVAPEERPLFPCTQCDRKYTSKGSLQIHIKRRHMDSRPKKKVHRCAVCGFVTSYKSTLRVHEKIHLAPEERQMFPCPHCDKKYTTNQTLQHHIISSHADSRLKKAKIYRCAECNYKTPKKTNLHAHETTHVEREERRTLECARCGKKYSTKPGLKFHIVNGHNDSRSKKAQKKDGYEERKMFGQPGQCDEKFTSNRILQRHIKSDHMDSRDADCEPSTDKWILDSLKIEIDDYTPHVDGFINAESLSATANKVKSEFYLKVEPDDVVPDDVSPNVNENMADNLKNTETVSVTKQLYVKLVNFMKIEPEVDDDD